MKIIHVAFVLTAASSTPAMAQTYFNPQDYVDTTVSNITLSGYASQAKTWASAFLGTAAKSLEADALRNATTYNVSSDGKTVTEQVKSSDYNSYINNYNKNPVSSVNNITSYSAANINYTDPKLKEFSGSGWTGVYAYINGSLDGNLSLTLTKFSTAVASMTIDYKGYNAVINLDTANKTDNLQVTDFAWSYNWQTIADSSKKTDAATFLKTANVQINGSKGAITPVPGPEAGAGFGAVAMAGMVIWMKRRRRDMQTS